MNSPSIESVRAVIMAGGKGTRLRPLTAVFPKPLVPLGTKPVLEILLRRLSTSGIRQVTVCTGYLGSLIRAVFGSGHTFGLEIEYVEEAEPLGTAGPLSLVPNLTDPFLVMNGDLLTTLDFESLVAFHDGEQADLTVAIFPREVKIDFGVIELGQENEFKCYTEKPTYHFDVSMGVNVIGRAAAQLIRPGQYLDMPELVRKAHAAGQNVRCYKQECRWLDIGRMDDYALAQDEFAENETAFLNGRHHADDLDHGSSGIFRPASGQVSADAA